MSWPWQGPLPPGFPMPPPCYPPFPHSHAPLPPPAYPMPPPPPPAFTPFTLQPIAVHPQQPARISRAAYNHQTPRRPHPTRPTPAAASTHAAKPRGPPRARAEPSSRDVAVAHQTARRLGASLPGETPDDIAAWIAARRRNWPSRTNVARKLADAARRRAEADRQTGAHRERGSRSTNDAVKKVDPGSGAMALLADYGSSEDEGEVREEERKGERRPPVYGVSNDGNGRGKGKAIGKSRGQRRRIRRKRKNSDGPQRHGGTALGGRPKPLLNMLLKNEVAEERALLLQAFRYLLNQKREEKTKQIGS